MPPLPLGHSTDHNETFSIVGSDRKQHLAMFGATGVGKTTLMANMIAADINAGAGVTVVDPHGSLTDDILELIPQERIGDVIYLNPGLEHDTVVGVNLLDVHERQHDLAVSSLVNIFKNLWPDAWGPRSEFILSNLALALLRSASRKTITMLLKLLTDRDERQQLATTATDPAVQWFFHYFDEMETKSYRDEASAPLINKVNVFVRNQALRAVASQHRNLFSFRDLLDQGKILLCDLSLGKLGPDVTPVIGSIVVTKLFLAALSRQDIPEDQRRPHYLYADEVQNFIYGVALPTILAQSRKYALFVTAATQTLSILPEDARESIFTNCNTIACFRVSGRDAEALSREFAAQIPPRELQTLADHELYLKTVRDHIPAGPYLLRTFPPSPKTGKEATRETVIRMSLARYGQRRSDIESKLKQQLVPFPAQKKMKQ